MQLRSAVIDNEDGMAARRKKLVENSQGGGVRVVRGISVDGEPRGEMHRSPCQRIANVVVSQLSQ